MGFEDHCLPCFPGAFTQKEFLACIGELLDERGFKYAKTIVGVSVCMEKPSCFLVKDLQTDWKTVCDCSTLSGMPFVGNTAFLKMQQLVPDKEEGYFVFLAFPHIRWNPSKPITEAGVERQGPSFSGCLGLVNFQKERDYGSRRKPLDWDNTEQSLIHQSLWRRQGIDAVSDIVCLTQLTYQIILDDVERLAVQFLDSRKCHYAIVTGVQIHGPDLQDWIWPGRMYAVTHGKKTILSFS